VSISDVANLASAISALLAAFFWAKVAFEKTPDHMALTMDQTNFDWLTKPLSRQARHNRRGALFAALAAVLQVIAAGAGVAGGAGPRQDQNIGNRNAQYREPLPMSAVSRSDI
jgi:hypothetical protein